MIWEVSIPPVIIGSRGIDAAIEIPERTLSDRDEDQSACDTPTAVAYVGHLSISTYLRPISAYAVKDVSLWLLSPEPVAGVHQKHVFFLLMVNSCFP